jgi:hypothetical protein
VAIVNGYRAFQPGTCAITLFNDPVLNTTWKRNNSGLGFVSFKEGFTFGLVLFGQGTELLNLLCANLFLKCGQQSPHFFRANLWFGVSYNIANRANERFDIEFCATAFDVSADVPTNCVAELAFFCCFLQKISGRQPIASQ